MCGAGWIAVGRVKVDWRRGARVGRMFRVPSLRGVCEKFPLLGERVRVRGNLSIAPHVDQPLARRSDTKVLEKHVIA